MSENKVNSIDVVVPVYNEEYNIGAFIERADKAFKDKHYSYRLILVDDGSADKSCEIIRDWIKKLPNNVALISLNRNYGQHSAIIAGFEQCTAEVIVTIDADLQNPPEGIPMLISKMEEDNYDIVGSLRGGGRKDNIFRKLASEAKDKMVRRITKSKIRDSGCMLRAYKKKIIDIVLQCTEHFIYIPVLADSFARKSTEIEIEHSARGAGESKYNVWKLLQLFFDILTGSTYMPLRVLTVFGGVMCAVSLLLAIVLIILRIFLGPVWSGHGLFPLFGILFFFIGGQFFVFGLIGEYICRISMDVRHRPKFIIGSKEGKVK